MLLLDDIYKNQTPKKSFVKDFFKTKQRLSKPLSYRGLTLVGISSPKMMVKDTLLYQRFKIKSNSNQ